MKNILIAIIILLCSNYAALCLEIPLTVQEASQDDITKTIRTNQPVSVGVPLLDSDNITTVNSLGLSGATVGQFRVLNSYPSGNIKWVLVDTVTSVTAGGDTTLTLTNTGSGDFGGSALATDNDKEGTTNNDFITISTGVATFVIKKTNFNFLDTVKVGVDSIVATGNLGTLLINDGTTDYKSADDSSSTATIDENGPAKCVIKCEGYLKNGGTSFIRYLVRLFFYKNSSSVRASVTLRNADVASKTIKDFHYFLIRQPTSFSGTKLYKFSRAVDETSGIISSEAHLYQAYTPQNSTTYVNRAQADLCPTESGLEIINGVTAINSLGNENDYSRGWAEYYNSSGIGATIGIKNLFAMWPAGFKLYDSGQIDIELFSSENVHKNNRMGWPHHETREVFLNFHTSSIDNDIEFNALQYPLVGRAPYSQYAKTGAFENETRLVSVAEEQAFFATIGKTWTPLSNTLGVRRVRDYGASGGDQLFDDNLIQLIDFYRTGYGGLYLTAYAGTRSKADSASPRSDDSTGSEIADYAMDSTCFNNGKFNNDHTLNRSMPLMYYLTGDERFKEAFTDWGEYRKVTMTGIWGAFTRVWADNNAGNWRSWSNALRDAINLYDLTGDPDYKGYLDYMMKQVIISFDDPADIAKDGHNLDRGFEAEGYNAPGAGHRIMSYFTYDLFSIAANTALYGITNDSILEDFKGVMLGHAWCYLKEVAPYKTYIYEIDASNSAYTRTDQASYLLANGYNWSGYNEFLSPNGYATIEDWLWDMGQYQPIIRLSEPASQALIFTYNNQTVTGYVDAIGTGRVDIGNSAEAANISKVGSVYTINWNAPAANISRYQVKISTQPMVENLNFDQVNRTYEYDPAIYNNFWASINVSNEPTPNQTQGAAETIDIDVAQVMTDYNTLYGLSVSDDAYLAYDSGTDYYVAVKYFVDASATAPTNNAGSDDTTANSTYTLHGTATATTGRTITGVAIPGETVTPDDGTWDELSEAWSSTVSLSLGANSYTATATDSSAETGQDTVVITRTAGASNSIIQNASGTVITQSAAGTIWTQ